MENTLILALDEFVQRITSARKSNLSRTMQLGMIAWSTLSTQSLKEHYVKENTNNIHELILSKHKCNKNSQVTQLIELSKKQFTTAAKK